MHRSKSGSGFPSMSSFNGPSNKRMRVQEPAKQDVVDDFMDDDDWGDLDEEAMDECMVLATQMCSQAPQNNNDVTKQDVGNNFSSAVGNAAHGENSREQFPGSYKNSFNDSGISSVKSSALNQSRAVQNSTKLGRGVAGHSNNVSRSNSYSHRFNDFSIPETTVQKSGPSLSKTVHSSGKVYNSIPIKGSSTSNTHGNTHPTTSGTATLSDGSNQVQLKKMQDEKAKLQEDVLMKQGEISLLRLELKRKEAALEAERLDRCTALEAAEKRGREKVASAASEAEAKTKESLRSVERLQGELHFKNREIEELTIRCKRLEQQSTQLASSQVASPPKKGRHESASLSLGVSPVKARNNFKSHLDFGGGPVSVRTVEVQTESSQPQGKRNRSRLSLDMAKGRVTGCRRASYMLSSHAMATVAKDEEVRAGSWSLAPKWASLVSQLIAEHQDSTSVEKHLVVLAIQRLQEVQTLLTTRDPDAARVPPAQGTAPVEWYEGSVVPALSMLESLIAPYGTGHEQSALKAACGHLSPLCVKEIVVNNRVRQHVLQTLEKIAKFTATNIEAVVFQQMITSLSDFCDKVDDWDDVLAMLRCLRALGSQMAFTSLLCTKAESCLINKVCMLINKYSGDRTVTVSHMLGWLAVLVTAPPPWLRSTCFCPSKLLTCLLKQSHLILDFTKPEKRYEKAKVFNLLKTFVRVLHCWSTADPDWWVKVASVPEYTAIMGTVVANASDLQIDRQTVDLLCDLYEFDEAVFDGC
ncbi:uncharacterized protein LOC125035129 [Penaeus chinensis]|uniref:uncharacterized protein LOC125035129 n=1 Tax=Penaeus chinensis TaxID=139456 RepID=UPI001FB68241|nr:uncharacterized protein LOC125035129 [Penaeus chinensis]XP_047483264.1 uncharacterized protein LOC125035129 [Penaeus chinensis]